MLNVDKQYEESLIEELEEILEGSFDGILVTDKDTNILFVNSSYERIAEIAKSDMEGKSMNDLANPVWMPYSVANVVAEQKRTVSKRQVVKSGRHIMVTGRPIFDADGEIKKIVINARDISEIYELTEELQKAKETGNLYHNRLACDDVADMEKSGGIVAASSKMMDVLNLAERVAPFQTTVLILGDSGVGKEEVAKFLHNNSPRKNAPFVAINCGAIPFELLESELFGYEKGAFTGAMQMGKKGLIEAAANGTIFLDEIGETSLDFQVKLLRFLETKEVRKVGGIESNTVDVRVIAATNKNLYEMVRAGTFREDLYYRLNVVQISIPSLNERIEDIMPLANFFLTRYNRIHGKEKVLTYDVIKELEAHRWVGNVRELKNVIENMVIVSNNEFLQTEDLPWIERSQRSEIGETIRNISDNTEYTLDEAVEQLEKLILTRARKQFSSTREIANSLNINQSTVVRKLQKYGIIKE